MRTFTIIFLACIASQDEESKGFVSKEANFRLRYPPEWRRIRAPEFFQLGLAKNNDIIMVGGGETDAGVESILESIREEQDARFDHLKELSRKQITAGGEKGTLVVLDVRNQGVKMNVHVAVFTHQGIAYRVVGVRVVGDRQEFEKDLLSIIESFEYVAERKEWLARAEGKPARTALLGGLISWELNRPRWKESTFDQERAYDILDRANFKHFTDTAWITLQCENAKGDQERVLEDIAQALSSTIAHPKTEPLEIAIGQRKVPGRKITGESGGYARVFRVGALVEDGLSLQFWLESLESAYSSTERDWTQLTSGLTFQKKSAPETPLAFPIPATYEPSGNPALAAILKKATRAVPSSRYERVSLSSDGSRALTSRQGGMVLHDLNGRKPASLAAQAESKVRFSPDGNRIVYSAENRLYVAEVNPFKVIHTFDLTAEEAVFGPNDGELLAVVRTATGAFRTNRLEIIQISDGSRKPIFEFALSRFSALAVSPDGKKIALSANRDYPRGAAVGGHVTVIDADGSNPRRLTQDPEEVESICWSADGTMLLVVRRVSVGDDGAVGFGGSKDAYRISSEGGKPVNLTRSGDIDEAWWIGENIYLKISSWNVPENHIGVFRLSTAELEKISAALDDPPVADTRRQVETISRRVRRVIGDREPVPDAALIEKTADAFSKGAEEAFRIKLDFSAESLDRLAGLMSNFYSRGTIDRTLAFAMGAYYGETLRRAARAEWKIKPAPFGEWIPEHEPPENPFAKGILPFSSMLLSLRSSEETYLIESPELSRTAQKKKLLLIYPPSFVRETMDQAAGASYREARRKIDLGEVNEALEILVGEMRRHPKNGELAQEVIALCEAARLPEKAKELIRQSVDQGSEVPDFLVRYASDIAEKDLDRAIEFCRKAVTGAYPSPDALLQLGKFYAAAGNQPVAESCWRRSYFSYPQPDRKEIRRLMGMDPSPDEE